MNYEEHKELSDKLRMIGKNIPKEMRSNLMKTVKPLEKQKYKIRDALKKSPSSFPKGLRRRLYESLERGDYDKKKQVIDHKLEEKMEKIVDEEVKRLINSRGGLEKVRREVAQDPFIKERLQHAN